LARAWRHYELTLRVPKPGDKRECHALAFVFEVSGGAVLLDDIEIGREGEKNPTAFRDDVVRVLKGLRPGIIRKLQQGGSTVVNTLVRRLRAFNYTNHKYQVGGSGGKARFSLHELYELCEYLESEPWYTLPGTLHEPEMEQFMEYLGAPPDVGLGKLRARLGHPKPWTEVFEHIHVEFGNEVWNTAGGYQLSGFNGPDYWKGLIETAKRSPYYKENIVFHAGGQAVNLWRNARIVRNAPNADCLAVAPYLLHRLESKTVRRLCGTRGGEGKYDYGPLFRWVFAEPVWRCRGQGFMARNAKIAREAGMELSVYEYNYHTTGGDAPKEVKNTVVTSLGGAVNLLNGMLVMMKELGVRFQCFFTLIQHSHGGVRLWGCVLNTRNGHERYRPAFLALAVANRVIAGDMVETVHEGEEPRFRVPDPKGGEGEKELPAIWSCAFKDGKKWGLILLNLDVSSAHPVAVRMPGRVVGQKARSWLLTADEATASNEYEEGEPRARVQSKEIRGFASGKRLVIPACSVLGLSWQSE